MMVPKKVIGLSVMLAFLVLLSGTAFACTNINTSFLPNATMSLDTDNCIYITDTNTTINALPPKLNVMIFLEDGDMYVNATLNLTVAEDIEALYPINQNITLADGEVFINTTLNLTVSEGINITCPSCPSLPTCTSYNRNDSIGFGQFIYYPEVNLNVSCPAFPALNSDVNLSTSGAVWQPADARYNATVRNTLNTSCQVCQSCTPSVWKYNESYMLAYSEAKTHADSNLTFKAPEKPKANLDFTLWCGENVNNAEWNISVVTRNTTRLGEEYAQLASSIQGCNKAIPITTCVDNVTPEDLMYLVRGNATEIKDAKIQELIASNAELNMTVAASKRNEEAQSLKVNELSGYKVGVEKSEGQNLLGWIYIGLGSVFVLALVVGAIALFVHMSKHRGTMNKAVGVFRKPNHEDFGDAKNWEGW